MISVIVPTFNRRALLQETLESVQGQTFRDWECIVVDDGSTDDTASFMQRVTATDKRFRYIRRPDNLPKGANSCRVVGLQQANGEFVKWFDSDDVMLPGLLAAQHATITRGFDGVFCGAEVWNDDLRTLLKPTWRPVFFNETDLVKDYLKGKIGWPTGSGLWRRTQVLAVKPFSETLRNSQEWLFHLKVICSNLHVGVTNEKLVKIRASADSISRNKRRDYFYNRANARIAALHVLTKTRNPGVTHLLKVILLHLKTFLKEGSFQFFLLIFLKLIFNLPVFAVRFLFGKKRIFKAEILTG